MTTANDRPLWAAMLHAYLPEADRAKPHHSTPEPVVAYYRDEYGHDCYAISVGGLSSIVSSAHLVEERIIQLQRQISS